MLGTNLDQEFTEEHLKSKLREIEGRLEESLRIIRQQNETNNLWKQRALAAESKLEAYVEAVKEATGRKD